MASVLSDKSNQLLDDWGKLHNEAVAAKDEHDQDLIDLETMRREESDSADKLIASQTAALAKAREALESVQADLGLGKPPPAPAAAPAPREDDGEF